uniref:MITD1 C-terminal phospholipase D-like domain-containing protein n=2 Tax=Parascaris TaxID=6254 RepID=A0A914RHV6_PAREQ
MSIIGSLRIEEVFSEAEARKSAKGYNVKLVKEIRIEDGSTGYGYDRLFVDALNSRLRSAANFVVFCEVVMSNAPNLQKIILRTQNDPSVDHRALFSHLRSALFQNGIRLEIQRSETIHDREIRFDNGWIYRIGRGLDYFQKQPYLTVGLSNYSLRRCLETIVCITKEM